MDDHACPPPIRSQRQFLHQSAALTAAAAPLLSFAPSAHAAGSDTLRIGMVGSGVASIEFHGSDQNTTASVSGLRRQLAALVSPAALQATRDRTRNNFRSLFTAPNLKHEGNKQIRMLPGPNVQNCRTPLFGPRGCWEFEHYSTCKLR